MANNPYQHTDADTLPPEPRVSALAVCSLVFGLVCCIPGSGLLATILGGAGMVRISKSEGRLSGRTLSFIGIALGIMSTAGWLAIGVGCGQAYSAFMTRVFVLAQNNIKAVESADWATARKLLDSKVAAGLTDDQLKAFRDGATQKFGAIIGMPQQFDFNRMFNQQPNLVVSSKQTTLPIPVDFKNGQAWLVVVTNSPETLRDILWGGKSIEGIVTNVGIVAGNQELWLIDPAAKSKPAAPKAPPPAPIVPDKPAGG